MHKPTVYMPGAMQFTDAADFGWREKIIAVLGDKINFLDPTCKEFQHATFTAGETIALFNDPKLVREKHTPKFRDAVKEIINADLRAVVQSQALCAYWTPGANKGAGVKGELTVAAWHNIPVILIVPDEYYEMIPGWTWGCVTHYVKNIPDAIATLRDIILKEE